ncbi:hypothetical protein B0H10DRAFT_1971881 [Mycena sp. CBHHK59/15]|nr:hypothetical protein B0H10DRAFT_1971881 [Mycena sp. CBHHK59/15]
MGAGGGQSKWRRPGNSKATHRKESGKVNEMWMKGLQNGQTFVSMMEQNGQMAGANIHLDETPEEARSWQGDGGRMGRRHQVPALTRRWALSSLTWCQVVLGKELLTAQSSATPEQRLACMAVVVVVVVVSPVSAPCYMHANLVVVLVLGHDYYTPVMHPDGLMDVARSL